MTQQVVQQTQTATQSSEDRRLAHVVGGVGVVLGGLLWFAGAKYTVEGGPIVANFLLSFFRLPFVVPQPDGLTTLWLAAPVGALFSYIEFQAKIRSRFDAMMKTKRWNLSIIILSWMAFVAYDVLSTIAGVVTASSNGWAIHVWIAANPIPLTLWSMFLTFMPEIGLRLSWRMLRTGRV